MSMNYQGKLLIKPVQARITPHMGRVKVIQPFLLFNFENQQYRTNNYNGGDMNLRWNDVIAFQRSNFGCYLLVRLIDNQNGVIGSAQINISDIFQNMFPSTRWIDLFDSGFASAAIQIDMLFQAIKPQYNGFGTEKMRSTNQNIPTYHNTNPFYQNGQTPQSNIQWQLLVQNIKNNDFSKVQNLQESIARQFGFQFNKSIQKQEQCSPTSQKPTQPEKHIQQLPQTSKQICQKRLITSEKIQQKVPERKSKPVNMDSKRNFNADQMDDILK